ncbi:MAG: hypothetical protein ACKV19_23005 [Verrucomicrobiales bacterium]
MKPALKQHWLTAALAFAITVRAADPLPSWDDGPARQAITTFVEKVTKEGSPDFAPVAGHIAAFDNDGTLWAEQPMYVQAVFVFDSIKRMAP